VAGTRATGAGVSRRVSDSRHLLNIEREYLARALQQAGGVKVRAAGLLGMSFRSFRYYLKKYHLS